MAVRSHVKINQDVQSRTYRYLWPSKQVIRIQKNAKTRLKTSTIYKNTLLRLAIKSAMGYHFNIITKPRTAPRAVLSQPWRNSLLRGKLTILRGELEATIIDHKKYENVTTLDNKLMTSNAS